MEAARRIASIVLAVAGASALAGLANANVLYKSIGPDGRVTFSDAPVDKAVSVQRIEMSDSAKPAAAAAQGEPIYLALADSYDEVIAQANARVDMAEHALALARRALEDDAPLALAQTRLGRDEARQLDFFKQDVVSARKNLMRVLKQRNAFAQTRPLA